MASLPVEPPLMVGNELVSHETERDVFSKAQGVPVFCFVPSACGVRAGVLLALLPQGSPSARAVFQAVVCWPSPLDPCCRMATSTAFVRLLEESAVLGLVSASRSGDALHSVMPFVLRKRLGPPSAPSKHTLCLQPPVLRRFPSQGGHLCRCLHQVAIA